MTICAIAHSLMKPTDLYPIVFYNLENLFDTIDDPNTLDDEFTPKGSLKWNKRKYERKLHMLAKAIYAVGQESGQKPPILLGVSEVENRKVVEDLLQTGDLQKISYDFVHYDSPDERGIDNALIYDPSHFKVVHAEPLAVLLYTNDDLRDTTRDILYVHGILNGEEVHVYVNHWPSRRENAVNTEQKRIDAAKVLRNHVQSIIAKNGESNFLIMGDFNDDPFDKSVKVLMDTGLFFNPMEQLLNPYNEGTTRRKNSWNLFDQIILSHSFLKKIPNTNYFYDAGIFNEDLLAEWKGKFKGNPFRTYVGKRYLGGYSDHFPVYVLLQHMPTADNP